MKKIILIITVLMTISGFGQAQPKENVDERIAALKVGFLTDRLNLSAEEAKSFWPVYNNFRDELEALRKSRRENIRMNEDKLDELSDKEVEKSVDAELAFRQSEIDIFKKYHSQFKQVLPIKKVAKLYRAEEDFKRQLLERMRDGRKDGPPGNPGEKRPMNRNR